MEYRKLTHSTYYCNYHVVFIPKYRRKVLYGNIKQHLGSVFHDLARQKECKIEVVIVTEANNNNTVGVSRTSTIKFFPFFHR